MARLNLNPGFESGSKAKQNTSLPGLSSAPAPSSSPDSTVVTCLGVIPQNDLQKVANRTDIVEFIEAGDRDLESALEQAQAIVHDRHRLSQDVALHCAFDIRTVWHQVAKFTSRTPTATATITQWQQDIRRDIDIDRYLSMADSTLRKYDQYIARIERAWDISINIALPQELIPTIGWLSKSLMQKMAQLAEGTSREEAAMLLKENVSQRTGHLTRTAHTRTSQYLTLSDVTKALERSNAKASKTPKARKRVYAGPTDTAKKKRKAALVQERALASDPTTSRAGSELKHDEGEHASSWLSDGNPVMGEHVVEPQTREEQNAIDTKQGVGTGGGSMQMTRQLQDDCGRGAGTSYEHREVSGDHNASHNDSELDPDQEMSIERGRGDMTSLDGFDNTTRSGWLLERSAPPTPINCEPRRSSELPDVLHSDLDDSSLSTPNAVVPFRNNDSTYSCLMSQSHLTPLPASRLVNTATCNSEPWGEGETSTNASYQEPEQQTTVNAMGDQHSRIREGETLEASELSYHKASLSPEAKSISETSGKIVDVVSNDPVAAVAQTIVEPRCNGIPLLTSQQQVRCTTMAALVSGKAVGSTTGKRTVAKDVIESNPAGKQQEECTTDIAVEQDTAQTSSRSRRQDNSYDSSEIRRTALLTLQPGQQLSSTAIQEVISCVKPADCHVFDPLFFNNPPFSPLSKRFQIDDTVTRILLPIHDSQRKHWYLAVVMISDSTIKIYDSMSCKEQSLSQSTDLESFVRKVKPQQQAWVVRLAECPQQNNGYDCGVHVIVNALHVMAQDFLPAAYDGATWRLLCRSLLGETINNNQFNSLVEIADSKTNDFVPSNTQADDEDGWIIATLQRAVMEAETCLRALRTKQARLQSLHNASRSSLRTLRVLYELARKAKDDFAKNFQIQLRSHSDIFERSVSSITGTPECQSSALRTAVCSIRSAHNAIATCLQRAERKVKSLEGGIERLLAAIETGQRMEKIWETKIQQIENERRAKIKRMESWREHFDSP